MMYALTLRFKNKELKKYILKADQTMDIGRLNENGIVIDNISVSGRHAKIYTDETGFLVEDLYSTNGTFVNDKPIIKVQRLKDEDIITIGKHELLFSCNASFSMDDLKLLKKEMPLSETGDKKTGFIDTKAYQQMIEKDQSLGNKVPLLTVQFKDKLLYKYLLKYKTTRIGRNSDNHVVIDNVAVSGEHAQISMEGDQFFIEDLNSKNGTFVNKKHVKKHQLMNGDSINIGKHEVIFEEYGNYTWAEVQSTFDGMTDSSSMSTTFLNTKEHKDMIAKNLANDGNFASLIFIEGGEGEIKLTKKITKIGKDPSSDIVAKGLMVGKTAALICMEPDGYYISCQDGISKPLINGSKFNQAVKLADTDIIEIGSVKVEIHF